MISTQHNSLNHESFSTKIAHVYFDYATLDKNFAISASIKTENKWTIKRLFIKTGFGSYYLGEYKTTEELKANFN
jgi:hypothetical protein